MNLQKFIFILFCLSFSLNLLAQTQEQKTNTDEEKPQKLSIDDIKKDSLENYMVLYKMSKPYRLDFPKNSKIIFRLKADKKVEYNQMIQAVYDSSFVALGSTIDYKDVYAVKVYRNKPFLTLFRNVFCIGGGVSYFLIDLVNNSFTTTSETLIVSGSFISLGGLLTFLVKPRTYKLNKNRFLKTLKRW